MYSRNYDRPEVELSLGKPYLKTLNYIRAENNPDWSFYMHSHNDALEISYILAGKGAVYCDGKFFALTEGDIVIKNPLVSHAESSDSADPIEQVCLSVDGLKVGGNVKNVFPIEGLSPIVKSGEKKILLDALFRDILEQAVNVNSPNMEYINALLRMVLTVILHHTEQLITEREHIECGELMHEVRRYIETHYTENLCLGSIADIFHLSIYYLARQFKKYTGFTLNTYILSCRMGEAQRRLIFTDDSISEIAQGSGYSNLSYFYATFKKKVGCTPKAYKNIYKLSAK